MTSTPYFHFVRQFFTLNDCTIVEESESHIKFQLTSEMDEEIMNRPFYWHYMRKMDREGAPMQLAFTEVKRDDDREGIYLHAGTPKLHTIYQTAKKRGRTTRLYESLDDANSNGALQPWLIVNHHLHFRGKQTKTLSLSIGINLINGMLLPDMMTRLEVIDFSVTVSDYTFPVTPIIGLLNAYKRMESYMESYISSLEHQWAYESLNQLKEEEALLQSFYESNDIAFEPFTNEVEQLNKRYNPRITIEAVNGGLFYLSHQTCQNIIQ